MGFCFVPNCTHRSGRESCKFFRFPLLIRSPARRRQWKKLIRRADRSPGKDSRVCSCHFEHKTSGENPSIFPWMKENQFAVHTPDKKKRAAKRKLEFSVSLKGGNDSPVEPEEPTPENDIAVEAETGNEATTPDAHEFSQEEAATLRRENLILSSELYMLREENRKLKETFNGTPRFSFENIQTDEGLIAHFTGLPNASTFHFLSSLFKGRQIKYYKKWNVHKLSLEDQLFLTLMKLRRNPSNMDLSVRFGVSAETVSSVIITWIHALHAVLMDGLMKNIPSVKKNKLSLPACFNRYENCRIILDCTEVFADCPASMKKQNAMFSSYQHHITLKGLVGIAPNGTVTFCSKLYPGATSDKAIVADSGVISQLDPGDLVMADKGFLIGDLPEGVSLNIPPFSSTPQFTPAQVETTLRIARARIHVERAIQRIKTFRILQLIPSSLFQFSSIFFQVCCMLTSFKCPLIQEVSSTM